MVTAAIVGTMPATRARGQEGEGRGLTDEGTGTDGEVCVTVTLRAGPCQFLGIIRNWLAMDSGTLRVHLP